MGMNEQKTELMINECVDVKNKSTKDGINNKQNDYRINNKHCDLQNE